MQTIHTKSAACSFFTADPIELGPVAVAVAVDGDAVAVAVAGDDDNGLVLFPLRDWISVKSCMKRRCCCCILICMCVCMYV